MDACTLLSKPAAGDASASIAPTAPGVAVATCTCACADVRASSQAASRRTMRLRWAFVGSTIVTIAHRLQTVIDFDRILVLSKGAVAEFGSH